MPTSRPPGYTWQEAREYLEDILDTDRLPPESVKSDHALGVLYGHRLVCVRAFRDAVYEMLNDTTMTRAQMRVKVGDLAKQLEEHGAERGAAI